MQKQNKKESLFYQKKFQRKGITYYSFFIWIQNVWEGGKVF